MRWLDFSLRYPNNVLVLMSKILIDPVYKVS